MIKPKENEEINEELSTDELKDVSGGIMVPGEGTNLKGVSGGRSSFPDTEGHWGEGEGLRPNSPHGSGFGGTLKDWKIANKNGINWDLPDTSSGVY